MASDEKLGSDFVSIVVADSTRIHTNSWPMLCRRSRLQVVASASNSEELLALSLGCPSTSW